MRGGSEYPGKLLSQDKLITDLFLSSGSRFETGLTRHPVETLPHSSECLPHSLNFVDF